MNMRTTARKTDRILHFVNDDKDGPQDVPNQIIEEQRVSGINRNIEFFYE